MYAGNYKYVGIGFMINSLSQSRRLLVPLLFHDMTFLHSILVGQLYSSYMHACAYDKWVG